MDLILFVIGGFVIEIFFFRRELLIDRRTFRLVLLVSIALFFAGLVLHFTEIGRHSISGALLVPLFTLALFRLFRRVFLIRFKHEPRDTFLDWRSGLGADKLFDFVYFMSAILLLMLLSVGMEKLAKAGW